MVAEYDYFDQILEERKSDNSASDISPSASALSPNNRLS